ncbi:hypothetical protein [Streptomyces sp. NPDC004721]
MTEQTEDTFWAEERARDAAERGRHADPGACGTCTTATAAGGQVEHDECAKRATLLPAPDAPGYELITGMTEEEVWALPARFHHPVFMESSTPKAWVCAVCWGDGWSTLWPCKTAVDQGLRVFTADDYAETAAKRQAAELAAYRALELGNLDGRVSAACGNPEHPTWLRKPDDARGCPWCRLAELESSASDEQLAEIEARVTAATDGPWERYTGYGPHFYANTAGPYLRGVGDLNFGVGDQAAADEEFVRHAAEDVRTLLVEVRRQRAELAKYVGKEPTIAEEMAYLSRCINTVLDLCTKAEEQAGRWEQPLPVPEWVAPVRAAAEGLVERRSYPPALPWAQLMDDEDLQEFLAELSGVAVGRSVVPNVQDALADVEDTCARWRAIAEAQHAHNTAPGPNAPKDGEDQ